MDNKHSSAVPEVKISSPGASAPGDAPSFFKVVQLMSHIRGIYRQVNPSEYSTLSPRVMNIPEDPSRSSVYDVFSGAQWSSDTSRILKAVDEESLEQLQALLSSGASVNAHGGAFQETPIHKAAQQGWAEGLELLLSSGASVCTTNQFGQTPIHYAAASKSLDCVQKLLDAGSRTTLDHKDMRGHTPLHDAAALGHPEGVIQLLNAGASVDVIDKNKETPLFKAAKSRCIYSMLALLNCGADLGARDNSGESVLSHVLRHLPAGMDALLDHCLIPSADKLTSKKIEISFNFVPLAGCSEAYQMKTLSSMVGLGHPKLLLHPLCEAFLLLKWHNVKRLFFVEVIFYFIHAILATILILNKFVWKQVKNTSPEYMGTDVSATLSYILYIQAGFIIVKQLLTIIQSVRAWIFSLWHILNLVIPVLVLLVIPGSESLHWQHHLATITLLVIWVQCMLHIGRFPGCGIYVAMFTKVAKVFLKIFLIFFCLILGFSMSFYVSRYGGPEDNELVENNDTKSNGSEFGETYTMMVKDRVYGNPAMTFLHTLTMMIGELNFDSIFVTQLDNLPVTAYFIYLIFVILVSIILSNLLVALAVNDVQGLRNSAHLERLIKQMELVFQMEKTFGSISSISSCLRCTWFASKVKSLIHDWSAIRVFMQPHHPQKGTKLFIVENGILKEVALRQSHVKNVMECLKAREEEAAADRKISIRRAKSRQARPEYSSSAIDDDMRESLKQLEKNLMGALNDRLDDFTGTFAALSSKIKNMEAAMVSGGLYPSTSTESLNRVGSAVYLSGITGATGGGAVTTSSVKHRLKPQSRATQNGAISLTLPSAASLRRQVIQARNSQPAHLIRTNDPTPVSKKSHSQPVTPSPSFPPGTPTPYDNVCVEIEMVQHRKENQLNRPDDKT